MRWSLPFVLIVVALLMSPIFSTPPAANSTAPPLSVVGDSPYGPRIGLDLTFYVRAGFGSLHGVNCNLAADASQCYNYLVHGWQDSGGLANGTCPAGHACSGGYFTAFAYELQMPPEGEQGAAYINDRNWILNFVAAANADHGGQQAKIFIRFIPLNDFDSTLSASFDDFLSHLGPAQDNPSVAGIGIRGDEEGLDTGGCPSGCTGVPSWEGSSWVGADRVYGEPYDSFPGNATRLDSLWGSLQAKANAYGYPLGISTGVSQTDLYFKNVLGVGYGPVNSLAQWFIQGDSAEPSVQAPPSQSYTQNYNTFYDTASCSDNSCRAAGVSVGTVYGEWDPNWFVSQPPNGHAPNGAACPNNSGYCVTQYAIQSSMSGFAAGHAVNQTTSQFYFIYGMPYLTADDQNSINQWGVSPFLQWYLQYATQYGFMTSFSPVPPAQSIPAYQGYTPPLVPTGLYIHILGDASLDSRRPGYSQTDPVYCCGDDTFTLDGRLVSLASATGIPGETIRFYTWGWAQDAWVPLVNGSNGVPITATTNSQGYFGRSTWCPTCSYIRVTSPPEPPTAKYQDFYMDQFAGDSTYQPANGIVEDLPVILQTSTATSPGQGPTRVSCASSTLLMGESVTCTATVAGSSPTGTVAWSQTGTGGVSFSSGSCTLSPLGQCQVNVTGTSAGPVTLNATYSGDSNNRGSSGAFAIAVNSVAATCSKLSPLVGTTMICRAAVAGSSPTGKVTWSSSVSGKFYPSTCVLSKGACSVRFVPTTSGTAVVTAAYFGDGHNAPSTGGLSVTVTPRTSKTVLYCSPASAVAGSSTKIKCTAIVTGYLPKGTVTWAQTGVGSVSFSSPSCSLANSRCSVTLSGKAAGSVTIQAFYGGDANNGGSSKTRVLTIK